MTCTAGWCNHLQMEVRSRRLCRSHLRRFKQNRSEALCFFFCTITSQDYACLQKQHANEQTSENIHEPGSEIRTRLHLPFQSSSPPKKAPFWFLPLQFCYILLPGSFVSVETLRHFIPEEFFTLNSFSLTLFAFLIFLFQILSVFNVSFAFRAFVKNSACHQSPSAGLTAPVEGQRQKNLSLFSSIMTGLQVCTSWMCVHRSSSWG